MKNIYKLSFIILICVASLSAGANVFAYQNTIANAGPDLYLTSGQNATLQGSGYDPNGFAINFYWTCSGGTLSNYNIAQPVYTVSYTSVYTAQTIYTCTLTVTNNYGNSSSDSMHVYVNYGNGNNYYGSGSLIVSKKVMNLSSGNTAWQTSINANPSDVLSFAIILQPDGRDIHNVIVRDILPANLIYKGNLSVNTNYNFSGDLLSGINIGTVYANQAVVVAYQAQVAPAANFNYGTTTINNNATVTSNESGAQTSLASVLVNRTAVQGATYVSTGQTNNFLTDSFFLPLLLIVIGLWFYRFQLKFKK